MKIVTVIFETKAQAEDAVRALEDAGIASADISLIAPNSENDPSGVAGGLVGSLTEAGVDERDAHVYGESLRRGEVLVTARVDDEELDATAAILGQSGSVDVDERREEDKRTGWSPFDETADPRSYRREDEPDSPVIIPPLPR